MCACGKGKSHPAGTQWAHIAPSGKVTKYDSEGGARMAVAREGGQAKPASS